MKKGVLRSSRLIMFIFAFSLTGFSYLHAQITGTITDAVTGEPLIGATVQISGSTVGTIADFDGNYTINASQGDVLKYTYVGYLPKEVTVGAQSSINMQLKEDIQELEKVVIVGYTTKKKSDLTGAVTSVSSKELSKVPSTSVASALQGRAAGVMVTQQSGKPGGGSNIRIRGTGTFNNAEPLYVVDGVPLASSPNLRPEEIESIEILKDASATGIYGNRGANGVIIISTKRGSKGKPKIDFSMYGGITTIPKTHDLLNAEQYRDYINDLYNSDTLGLNMPAIYVQDGAAADSIYNANGRPDTDWQDEILRMGSIQNYSLGISGGAENSNYSIGLNYFNEKGILINTYSKRFSFRANSDFQINKRIKIGESFNVSRQQTRNPGEDGAWGLAQKASPMMPVYDSINDGGYAGPNILYTGNNDKTNPVAGLDAHENIDNTTRVMGNIYMNAEIFKGLSYEFRIGTDYKAFNDYDYDERRILGRFGVGSSRGVANTTITRRGGERYMYNINNLLRYIQTFNKHDVAILLGHESSEDVSNPFSATIKGTSDAPTLDNSVEEGLQNISGEKTYITLLSYFGRIDYDFNNKYFFTGNFRADGSSRFIEENYWGYFPSFSLGWKFSEENFMQGLQWLSTGKLRGGWGKVGNQGSVGAYEPLAYLDPFDQSRYTFGNPQTQYFGAMVLESFANENMTWETTKTTTIGTDLSFFENKILFTTEYYYRVTEDVLLAKPVSIMTGRLRGHPPLQNVGSIENKGWEFSLSYRKYEGVFNYSASANLTSNKNRIVDFDGEVVNGTDNLARNQEGYPIGAMYGYVTDGLVQIEDFDENLEYKYAKPIENTVDNPVAPGDIKYVDLNGDGKIDANDRTIIGKSNPDWIMGVSLEADYRGFDLSVFIQGMYGFNIYNAIRQDMILPNETSNGAGVEENKLIESQDYWTIDNTGSDIPGITKGDPNNWSRPSDYHLWLEDASFTRLKDLQLGYSLPSALISKVNINSLRIYISAQNLYTLTKYTGYDPEMDPGEESNTKKDGGTYPIPRTYLFGVQLSF